MERRQAAWMWWLLVFLFLLFPTMGKVDTMKCPIQNPFPIPHEWYQPGDFIIGGIASQICYTFYEEFFKVHPSENMFELPQ